MSLIGNIKTLFADKEKTSPVFPTTKIKAVSDDNGVGLNILLDDKADKGYVENAIAAGFMDTEKVFLVTTSNTFAEVKAAIDAGKLCFYRDVNALFPLYDVSDTRIRFLSVTAYIAFKFYAVSSDDKWTTGNWNVQAVSSKASEITEANSTSDNYYPSTKAVYNYVATAVATIPTPDVSGQINDHNTATDAHSGVLLSSAFYAGTSAPSNTKILWIDTTASTGGLKYYNGSAWVHVPVAYT